MVDILLYRRQPLRSGGARARNYRGAFDKPGGGKHAVRTKVEKRTVYEYPVKIVIDPLEIGGFKPGSSFSMLEYEMMLVQGTFTLGTTLMIGRALRFVHGNGDRVGQCVKKFKPK